MNWKSSTASVVRMTILMKGLLGNLSLSCGWKLCGSRPSIISDKEKWNVLLSEIWIHQHTYHDLAVHVDGCQWWSDNLFREWNSLHDQVKMELLKVGSIDREAPACTMYQMVSTTIAVWVWRPVSLGKGGFQSPLRKAMKSLPMVVARFHLFPMLWETC